MIALSTVTKVGGLGALGVGWIVAHPRLLERFKAVKEYTSVCFFFQAEDGIRDLTVTGVQTCALPICNSPAPIVPAPKASDVPRNERRLIAPLRGLALFPRLFRKSFAVGLFIAFMPVE